MRLEVPNCLLPQCPRKFINDPKLQEAPETAGRVFKNSECDLGIALFVWTSIRVAVRVTSRALK